MNDAAIASLQIVFFATAVANGTVRPHDLADLAMSLDNDHRAMVAEVMGYAFNRTTEGVKGRDAHAELCSLNDRLGMLYTTRRTDLDTAATAQAEDFMREHY